MCVITRRDRIYYYFYFLFFFSFIIESKKLLAIIHICKSIHKNTPSSAYDIKINIKNKKRNKMKEKIIDFLFYLLLF